MKQNIHHGLCKKKMPNGQLVSFIHFEIWNLFRALYRIKPISKKSSLSGESNIVDISRDSFFPPLDSSKLEYYCKNNEKLEVHFRNTLEEFIFSLDLFQHNLKSYEEYLNDEKNSINEVSPSLKTAGIAAKSIFISFNVLVDDLAKLIKIIYKEEPLTEDYSFTMLEKDVLGEDRKKLADSSYIDLVNLFTKLNRRNSWFKLAFFRGEGIRQRFIHYTDIIQFGGQKGLDESLFRGRGYIINLHSGKEPLNFIEELRAILLDFCDWLDQLYEILYKELQTKNKSWPKVDRLYSYGCGVNIPTFFDKIDKKERTEQRTYPDENYLYFPIAENL